MEIVKITEELYSLVSGRSLNCLPRLLLLCIPYFGNLGSPCTPPSCCSYWPCHDSAVTCWFLTGKLQVFFPCQPMWTFWLAAWHFARFIWVLVYQCHCHSTGNNSFIYPQCYRILANVSSNEIKHFALSVHLSLLFFWLKNGGRSLS